MRYLVFILLFTAKVNATVYYVSNAGSDANNGTSTGTSWQTIAKVNAQTFAAGDQILFKCGDSWNERLNVQQSGTRNNPIIFGSYNTGAKPIITGFQTQGGFTNVGNIWTATATNATKQLNLVLINGNPGFKARTPNTGWSTFTTHTTTSITTGLSGTPNYTGSQVVVRGTHWIIDIRTISSQSGGVLNWHDGLTYDPTDGNGYFIQNTISDLDVAGEWQYDSTSKVLKVYATSSPTVLISTIDTLVNAYNVNYITFDGIAFTGANKTALNIDTTHGITIQNCLINYSGWYGVSGQSCVRARLLKDSVFNVQSTALFFRSFIILNYTDSIRVDSCRIHNTGVTAGMNKSGNGEMIAVSLLGDHDSVTNNVIDSTGYIPIYFAGRQSFVAYNYINYQLFVKDDGGGIYTWAGFGSLPDDEDMGATIRSNIIQHSSGAPLGVSSQYIAAGIYCDAGTKGVRIDSNTISDAYVAAMFADARTDSNNYISNLSIDSIGYCFYIGSTGGTPHDINISDNVFYSRSNAQLCILLYVNTLSADYNHYLRPVSENTKMGYAPLGGISFAQWQGNTIYDANGQSTPAAITGTVGTLYINPTHHDSTFTLPGGYWINARGWPYYSGTITVGPFQSALVFNSTAPPSDSYFPRKFYKKVIQL